METLQTHNRRVTKLYEGGEWSWRCYVAITDLHLHFSTALDWYGCIEHQSKSIIQYQTSHPFLSLFASPCSTLPLPSNQRHLQPKRGRMEIFGSVATFFNCPCPLFASPCSTLPPTSNQRHLRPKICPTKETSNQRERGWKSASCGLPRRQKLLLAHIQVVEVTSLTN